MIDSVHFIIYPLPVRFICFAQPRVLPPLLTRTTSGCTLNSVQAFGVHTNVDQAEVAPLAFSPLNAQCEATKHWVFDWVFALQALWIALHQQEVENA